MFVLCCDALLLSRWEGGAPLGAIGLPPRGLACLGDCARRGEFCLGDCGRGEAALGALARGLLTLGLMLLSWPGVRGAMRRIGEPATGRPFT